MSEPKNSDSWQAYPALRWVYNKLELSQKLGYNCGPDTVPVPSTGKYVERPIMNLSNMGVSAKIVELEKGDTIMTPGHFWCEYFEGDLVSVDYTFRKGELYPQQAMKGIHHSRSLSAFNKWEKVEPFPEYDLPSWVDGLSSAKHINLDFKGGKIIEVHLRHNIEYPKWAVEVIPIWEHEDPQMFMDYEHMGYIFMKSKDNANGNLDSGQIGFYYK